MRSNTHYALRLFGLAITVAGMPAFAAGQPQLVLDGPAKTFLPDRVSTPYSEVRVALSPDGRTILWGSIDRPGGPGGWDIWMIRRDGKGWSAPQPVSFDTPHKEFDPSFSEDGRLVWFFSNRPGGLGGDDIWQVSFDPQGGTFGSPENAGAGVNSAGDEWAPSISDGGRTLLFASNGRGGQGRHDLFLSRLRDGEWQAAQSVQGEVNTGADEFDAVLVDGGRLLVYTHSENVDQAPIELWSAVRGDDGGYHAPARLDARINAAGGFALGPALDPTRPGVLLFSGSIPQRNLGKSDIYAIRYRVQL
jgi:hypothetical protein